MFFSQFQLALHGEREGSQACSLELSHLLRILQVVRLLRSQEETDFGEFRYGEKL